MMFCSYCKEFDKITRNNSSQAVNQTKRLVDAFGQNQRPKTGRDKRSLLFISLLLTNYNCKPTAEFCYHKKNEKKC